jgi:hypothetical protein
MLRSIAFYSLMLLVILAGAAVGVLQHVFRSAGRREEGRA